MHKLSEIIIILLVICVVGYFLYICYFLFTVISTFSICLSPFNVETYKIDFTITIPAFRLLQKYDNDFKTLPLVSNSSFKKIFDLLDSSAKEIETIKYMVEYINKDIGVDIFWGRTSESFISSLYSSINSKLLHNIFFKYYTLDELIKKNNYIENFIFICKSEIGIKFLDIIYIENLEDIHLENFVEKGYNVVSIPKILLVRVKDNRIGKLFLNLNKRNNITIHYKNIKYTYKLTGAILKCRKERYCLLDNNCKWEIYDKHRKIYLKRKAPTFLRFEKINQIFLCIKKRN